MVNWESKAYHGARLPNTAGVGNGDTEILKLPLLRRKIPLTTLLRLLRPPVAFLSPNA